LLLSDDGVGVHTIQRLQEVARLPEEVQVVDDAGDVLVEGFGQPGGGHLVVPQEVEHPPAGVVCQELGDLGILDDMDSSLQINRYRTLYRYI